MGSCYLLHFDKPYKHAKHYLGYVDGDDDAINERTILHYNGQGANLTKVIKEAGIGFTIARTWHNVDRHFERQLKIQGGHSRKCPICKQLKRKL